MLAPPVEHEILMPLEQAVPRASRACESGSSEAGEKSAAGRVMAMASESAERIRTRGDRMVGVLSWSDLLFCEGGCRDWLSVDD